MKYAVIKLSGSEFRVSEGDILKVNKLSSLDPKVLMFSNGSKVMVGVPYLENVFVDIKVEGEEKGEKLKITRFKAKSRYDKTVGYRSTLSVLKVVSIGEEGDRKPKATTEKVDVEVPIAAKKKVKAKKV